MKHCFESSLFRHHGRFSRIALLLFNPWLTSPDSLWTHEMREWWEASAANRLAGRTARSCHCAECSKQRLPFCQQIANAGGLDALVVPAPAWRRGACRGPALEAREATRELRENGAWARGLLEHGRGVATADNVSVSSTAQSVSLVHDAAETRRLWMLRVAASDAANESVEGLVDQGLVVGQTQDPAGLFERVVGQIDADADYEAELGKGLEGRESAVHFFGRMLRSGASHSASAAAEVAAFRRRLARRVVLEGQKELLDTLLSELLESLVRPLPGPLLGQPCPDSDASMEEQVRVQVVQDHACTLRTMLGECEYKPSFWLKRGLGWAMA